MSKNLLLFSLCLILYPPLHSALTSITGEIGFDVNSDGHQEVVLNGAGLGIGTFPSANLHVSGNTMLSGDLRVGTISGNSNIELHGSIAYEVNHVSSNTILSNHLVYLVDTSSSNITLTLPSANTVQGRCYHIKKSSTNNDILIRDASSKNIDNASLLILRGSNPLPSIDVFSDGSQWYIKSLISDCSMNAIDLNSWWGFNESSGNTSVDLSDQGYTATMDGGLVLSGNTAPSGNAISFDGSTNYFRVTNFYSNFFNNQSSWSYLLWVYPTKTDSNLLSHPTESSAYIYIGANYELVFGVYFGTIASSPSNSVTPNQWNHIAVTRNGSNIVVYVNGELTHSTTSSTTTNASVTGDLQIGRFTTSTSFSLAGMLGETRFFSSTLTHADIECYYDSKF